MKTLLRLLSIPGLLFLGLLALRHGLQRRVLKRSEANAYPKGISSVEAVTLGGAEQWVLIQGEDRAKPVFLILHGGPGIPFPGVAYCSRSLLGQKDSELAKHFVLVYWDQRGSGKSSVPKESITLERLISDTAELADLLGRRFGVEKIFLGAISWGTVLGMSAVARHPEKFYAYVGWEQIANWARSDELAYRWALDRAEETENRKAAEQLTEIGPPPWREFERWSTLMLWLFLFGGFYRSESASALRSLLSRLMPFLALGLPALLSPFFTSPDYTLGDLLRLFPRLKTSQEALLDDIARIDLFASAPRVEVPVYFFHGMHDQAVQLPIARRYIEGLDASRVKPLTLLETSAHISSPEDARKVETFLIETLPDLANLTRTATE